MKTIFLMFHLSQAKFENFCANEKFSREMWDCVEQNHSYVLLYQIRFWHIRLLVVDGWMRSDRPPQDSRTSCLRHQTDHQQTHLVQVCCRQCFVQTVTVLWRCVGADRRQQQQQQHRSLHNTHPALRQKSKIKHTSLWTLSGQQSETREADQFIASSGPRWPLNQSKVCVCSASYQTDWTFASTLHLFILKKVKRLKDRKKKVTAWAPTCFSST